MATMKLSIITPTGKIFDNDVLYVSVPGSEGEFGILPGHASLVSQLKSGIIEFENPNGKKDVVAINWGQIKVDEKKVDIIADGAVAIKGGSESEIAIAIEDAKKLLKSASDSNITFAIAESKIEAVARHIV